MDYTRDAVLIHHPPRHPHPSPPPHYHDGLLHQITDEQLILVNPTLLPDDIAALSGNGSGNWTDDMLDYVPYEERIETYLVPVLFAIIFIIGVLGNGALIFIFIKHRTMRNVPNMYICSLAIGDILVIFFCVPFTSTVYTVEQWPYGLVVCKFSEFIKDVSIGVSVFTLTALSADRYFAIVDPMRKLAGRRATRVTILTIGGIWFASIVIALPSVLFSYVRVFNEGTEKPIAVCYPFPEEFGDIYPKAMVLFKALVYYFVPLVFITGFYSEMAHHLVLSTVNMPGESAQGQGNSGRQIQARKKVAKMVLSFVVIFALCFFLSHVFLLWFYFDPNSEENYNSFWNVVRILGFCLSFLNSCINPITLYCVSGTFRKYFNQYLFCCCVRAPHGRRTTIKSVLCPNLGHPSRRNSFQNSTSYKSDGVHLFGNSVNARNNGLYRASTLTSSTSLRTKVTWDMNRASPTAARLLNNSNASSAVATPFHAHAASPNHIRRNMSPPSPSHSHNGGSGYSKRKTFGAHTSNLLPIESASDESYHLYENPSTKLLNKDANVNIPLNNLDEPPAKARAGNLSPSAEGVCVGDGDGHPLSMTSFIENNTKISPSLEKLEHQ